MPDTQKIRKTLEEVSHSFDRLADQADDIARAGELVIAGLRTGGKVIFCGNGGSAADSQHLAAELVGRFMKERAPIPALSLTVDTSAITAIGNDYGYDQIFSRQLRGVGRKGDVLVGITTSGNSKNVLLALATARDMGIKTLVLTGSQGGEAAKNCDLCIKAPSDRTDQVQQMHIAIGHILCGIIEDTV